MGVKIGICPKKGKSSLCSLIQLINCLFSHSWQQKTCFSHRTFYSQMNKSIKKPPESLLGTQDKVCRKKHCYSRDNPLLPTPAK